MKTTTTTREYDDEGRMVKETVVEQDSGTPQMCTCTDTVYTMSYCPLHGYRRPRPWTISTHVYGNSDPAETARSVTNRLKTSPVTVF